MDLPPVALGRRVVKAVRKPNVRLDPLRQTNQQSLMCLMAQTVSFCQNRPRVMICSFYKTVLNYCFIYLNNRDYSKIYERKMTQYFITTLSSIHFPKMNFSSSRKQIFYSNFNLSVYGPSYVSVDLSRFRNRQFYLKQVSLKELK